MSIPGTSRIAGVRDGLAATELILDSEMSPRSPGWLPEDDGRAATVLRRRDGNSHRAGESIEETRCLEKRS